MAINIAHTSPKQSKPKQSNLLIEALQSLGRRIRRRQALEEKCLPLESDLFLLNLEVTVYRIDTCIVFGQTEEAASLCRSLEESLRARRMQQAGVQP